jgi:hypothetical protein
LYIRHKIRSRNYHSKFILKINFVFEVGEDQWILKFTRKLLLVIMILVILIFVEMQATHLAPITLHHSSVIIQVPHPSKLDNVRYEFHTCIKKMKLRIVSIKKEKLMRGDLECVL